MPHNHNWRCIKGVLASICILFLFSDAGNAKRPQILPEGMLVNVFALTQASAALRICANSEAYASLSANRKDLLQRLQTSIDMLVKGIAQKYDDDLFPFFVQSRDEAAAKPGMIKEMQTQYAFCNDKFFDRMKGYVYDSRQKLKFFLSQQPNVK